MSSNGFTVFGNLYELFLQYHNRISRLPFNQTALLAGCFHNECFWIGRFALIDIGISVSHWSKRTNLNISVLLARELSEVIYEVTIYLKKRTDII